MTPGEPKGGAGVGLALGLGAYLLWALIPIYFRAVDDASAYEVLAHRIVWAAPMLFAFLAVQSRLGEVRAALMSKGTLRMLFVSAALIAVNWLTFVWAIDHRQLLQASLGYYICPMVSVGMGAVFLGERITKLQAVGLGIAAVGVAAMASGLEGLPYVSVILAFSFSSYGLLRKKVTVAPLVGLLIEACILLPFMLTLLLGFAFRGEMTFLHHSARLDLLLMLAGIASISPLILFVGAAKRLQLGTVGMLQYIAPTGQLVLAKFLFKDEDFPLSHLVAFACIWTAVAIYCYETFASRRRDRLAYDPS